MTFTLFIIKINNCGQHKIHKKQLTKRIIMGKSNPNIIVMVSKVFIQIILRESCYFPSCYLIWTKPSCYSSVFYISLSVGLSRLALIFLQSEAAACPCGPIRGQARRRIGGTGEDLRGPGWMFDGPRFTETQT